MGWFDIDKLDSQDETVEVDPEQNRPDSWSSPRHIDGDTLRSAVVRDVESTMAYVEATSDFEPPPGLDAVSYRRIIKAILKEGELSRQHANL